MTYKFDSYCGLYCGACFIIQAYKQNRVDCIPEPWLESIQGKELDCYGCKSGKLYENCRGCKIRICAESKNVEFCNECPEYPCKEFDRIASYNLAHHNVAVENLKKIKEIGVQEWLQQQSERWLCPNCGSPFSWFEENCIECGEELFNCVKEDNQLKS